MKLLTFYNIFYKHRFNKAGVALKIYLYLTILIRFLYYKIQNDKKINLDKEIIKKKYLYDKDLDFLFEYFNSDKGSFFKDQFHKTKQNLKIHGHEYSKFYKRYLNNYRNKKIKILEIGAFKGGATAAFKIYFLNSEIYAGDLYPDIMNFFSKDIFIFKIDNSSEFELENFITNTDKKFDIIVEDAGHYFKDQIISLFILFKKLEFSGFFIIEELDFPDTREDMNILRENPTLMEILNCIINKKDFYSKYINNSDKDYFLKNYKSINIHQGRKNKIAFIKKK